MKQIFVAISIVFLLFGAIFGQMEFNKTAETEAFRLYQTGETKAWCPVCGMNLKMFYKTNHVNEDALGQNHQYCSIRCLAVDMEQNGTELKNTRVVDANTEKMISATKVHYVIGSNVPGTMTRSSKIAFKSKREAKHFLKEHQGKDIVGFDKALKMAKEQLGADNSMLMKKREAMVYPKAKMLFKKMGLQELTLPEIKSIPELKAHLKQLPQSAGLNEKQLQMLALYIWGVIIPQNETVSSNIEMMRVPKDAKCPVCGMFVYKYPKWASRLTMMSNGESVELYFDGVKDLMKFYSNPSQWGDHDSQTNINVTVTDYYSQALIDGKASFFVSGSDVLGPMGNELIPFTSREKAKTFMLDHDGKSIFSFSEINLELLNELDR